MKTKKLFLCAIIALFIFAITSPVYANYQSVYDSRGRYTGAQDSTWISKIREMEASDQVMGLTETKNADLTSTTSNNIDVHMIKNTEYGAVAILSASTQYGKQGEGTDRYVRNGKGLATTTGNVYGVYFNDANSQYEWVAAGGKDRNTNVADRYRNIYNSNSERKPGDATLPWHNQYISTDVLYYDYYGVVRRYKSIFNSNADNSGNYASRAAIVCGIGF